MNPRQEFKERSSQLAAKEQEIYCLSRLVRQQLRKAGGSMDGPSARQVLIPAALSAAVLLAMVLLRKHNLVVIVLLFALLYLLGKTYSEWKNYTGKKDAGKEGRSVADQLETAQEERDYLIRELNALRDSRSGKRYFWDIGLDPTRIPAMPGDMLQPADEWTIGVFNELQIENNKNGLYLHDFLREPLLCSARDIRPYLQQDSAELYRDDAVIASNPTVYAIKHVYAFTMDPIEEIQGYTEVQTGGKARARQQFNDQADEREKWWNEMMGGKGPITNEDAYYMGEMSDSEYWNEDTYRKLREREAVDSTPDTTEIPHYNKGFYGLWSMEFLSCALVLVAADGPYAGKAAWILRPNRPQKSLWFTVRMDQDASGNLTNGIAGYLESYLAEDPLQWGNIELMPSLALFAEDLFNEDNRRQLGLHSRDVLADKPKGLTNEEWVYLIRTDS